MTNLPTNPTKDELIQKYWWEFLEHVKRHEKPQSSSEGNSNKPTDKPTAQLRWEDVFWGWYVRHKMPPADQDKSEQA